jgi:Tfp pilus assembly protein PilO
VNAKSNLLGGSWIVTLPVAGLAVAYVLFLFLPGEREIGRLSDELTVQREFISGSMSGTAAVVATGRQLEEARQYASKWEESSPSEDEVSELFGRITALAKAAGATTTRFEPDRAVRHEALSRIPVVVGCTGSFGQVCRFIRDLESLPPTIWIEQMRIEGTGKDGQNVQCELVLEILADNSGDSGQVKLAG